MKKIIFILLLTTQVFLAQTGFEKGNTLYQKERYEQAISEYESVLAAKQHSAELYFNLGNCYYKLNKVAPAIYNYEKALVLNPDDTEIANNLKFAQKMQIDEIKVIPTVGFSKMVHDFASIFHYNTWAWISVGFSTLFLLCFIGYYFSKLTVTKRIFFFGMFGLLLLLLVSVSAAISEKMISTMKDLLLFLPKWFWLKANHKKGVTRFLQSTKEQKFLFWNQWKTGEKFN